MGKSLKAALRRFGGRRKRALDPYLATRELVDSAAPVIFDVGANVGATAQRYRALYPRAEIHCFEPYPPSFARLSAGLVGDGLVSLHPLALSSAPGRAALNVNRNAETNSLLPSDRRAALYWGEGVLETETEVEVPLQTLDGFCAEHSIARIDVLKLDVQGAEYSVLEGADALLSARRIGVIYTEVIIAPTYVGQRRLVDYLALTSARGYELFDLYNPTRRNGRLIQSDIIFVSADVLELYERGKAQRER
jgi:FkbM family methyltransferase